MKRLPNDAEYRERLKPFEHAMSESVKRGERVNPEGFWDAALDPANASLNAPEFLSLLSIASLMQVPSDQPTHEQIDARAQTLSILLRVTNEIGWGKAYRLLSQSKTT